MIRYRLRCGQDHEFEGWFRDSASFDKLAAAGLVECPSCGGTRVSRALMAPSIGRSREHAPPSAPENAAKPVPAELKALLQRVRDEVEKNCDYVGKNFAREARLMHAGESERRGIYGETSEAEADALREEGVEVARIPWVPRADG